MKQSLTENELAQNRFIPPFCPNENCPPVTYWLHKPELLIRIARMAVTCSCLRQMARVFGVSHNTVARYLSRSGRQSFLHHLHTIEGFEISESIAVDGFESFEYSQYFPCHFHLATGRDSWFLYYVTDSPPASKRADDEEAEAAPAGARSPTRPARSEGE